MHEDVVRGPVARSLTARNRVVEYFTLTHHLLPLF